MPKARFIERSSASFFMHRRCASFKKRKQTKWSESFLRLQDKITTLYFNEASPFGDMKRQFNCHDALAKTRMKRSAREPLRVPKARFIERSSASFFMHRRCASFKKSRTRTMRQGLLLTPFLAKKSRRSLVCNRAKHVWNQHEVLHGIKPKE